MTIRPATPADVPMIVAMGRRFLGSESAYRHVGDDPEQLASTAERLITGPGSVLLVADADGTVVGMLGLLIYPHFLDRVATASEVMWWVEPEARGTTGVRLLKAGEAWAVSAGAGRLHMIAPNDRVAHLYERAGFTLLERSYSKALAPNNNDDWREITSRILVADHVLTDPYTYRETALAQPFTSVTPASGLTFHGIADDAEGRVPQLLATRFPQLVPSLSFFRQSPEGQIEPHYIHSDADMGDWTAILFLTPEPPEGDGTIFWKHRATGDHEGNVPAEDWTDRTLWEPWLTVSAVFNRLVLFAAPLFHSRAIEANYGRGDAARLIQVVFGKGELALNKGA